MEVSDEVTELRAEWLKGSTYEMLCQFCLEHSLTTGASPATDFNPGSTVTSAIHELWNGRLVVINSILAPPERFAAPKGLRAFIYHTDASIWVFPKEPDNPYYLMKAGELTL